MGNPGLVKALGLAPLSYLGMSSRPRAMRNGSVNFETRKPVLINVGLPPRRFIRPRPIEVSNP